MATFERVIPLLTYQDIAAAHDFLVRAFGFGSGGVHRTPDGQAVHGEVQAGDAVIWLHDDVDAHYQHPRAAGGLQRQ
jgi:MerR family transcriptional regulator, thiopeptide resistance regulator